MDQTIVIQYSLIASAIIAAFASIAAAFNDSKVAKVGIGMVESIPIIAIVIAIVLVFANPFLG